MGIWLGLVCQLLPSPSCPWLRTMLAAPGDATQGQPSAWPFWGARLQVGTPKHALGPHTDCCGGYHPLPTFSLLLHTTRNFYDYQMWPTYTLSYLLFIKLGRGPGGGLEIGGDAEVGVEAVECLFSICGQSWPFSPV